MDPSDIAGVWVSIESRLILDDASRPDDLNQAKILFCSGADYWSLLTAEWDQWKTDGDIGIGRFRYLSTRWQAFNMHSLTNEQLNTNSLPVNQ